MHHWLSAKVPRDEGFRAQVLALCDLYTRPLGTHERVLALTIGDEKTSLQPRTRTSPTRPALPGGTPVQLEHEYQRKGAQNLLAAFDTRTGDVIGICRRRKRQLELIERLEAIDRQTPAHVTAIHLVCDNVITQGQARARVAGAASALPVPLHARALFVDESNQVEQWFSILQRKRLKVSNFADLAESRAQDSRLHRRVERRGRTLQFNWTEKSFEETLAKVDAALKAAA